MWSLRRLRPHGPVDSYSEPHHLKWQSPGLRPTQLRRLRDLNLRWAISQTALAVPRERVRGCPPSTAAVRRFASSPVNAARRTPTALSGRMRTPPSSDRTATGGWATSGTGRDPTAAGRSAPAGRGPAATGRAARQRYSAALTRKPQFRTIFDERNDFQRRQGTFLPGPGDRHP